MKCMVDAGGQFRSLAQPWADITTSVSRRKIDVLGGLTEVERDLHQMTKQHRNHHRHDSGSDSTQIGHNPRPHRRYPLSRGIEDQQCLVAYAAELQFLREYQFP
jgi:hypothetical protein